MKVIVVVDKYNDKCGEIELILLIYLDGDV